MTEIDEREELDASERARVDALVTEVAEREQRPGLGEAKLIALRTGTPALHFLAEDEGELAAYAVLLHSATECALEYCVAPAMSGRVELGAALVRRALVAARDRLVPEVQLFMLRPSESDEAVARELALEPTREIHEMRRPLPLERALVAATSALDTRGFVVGKDEDALLEVNAAAFADHPEQGTWDRDALESRERLDWFDAEGIRLLELDGVLAGFCWTKVHHEPERLGEIYVIGLAPGFQGRGLGRGLVVDGLEHLAARGERTASLYVEADNAPARGLYRALGFSVAHVDRIFSIRTGAR